jgi:TIR domain
VKRVFISYSHRQGEWVWDSLYPCLVAGGAEVLIDRKRFEAGRAVFDQMEATQDQADIHVLVLSPDYLASVPCRDEMQRAIAADPDFGNGRVVPVIRLSCDLPEEMRQREPLHVNLIDAGNAGPWELLLRACGASLSADAPHWLNARNQVLQYLRRGQTVNLVIKGDPKPREFLARLREDLCGDLALVDLDSGAAASRRRLVAEILKVCGAPAEVPPEPEDLAVLHDRLNNLSRTTLCLRHFDRVAGRSYGLDFFSALKHLVMDCRKLVLLLESRVPYVSLLPDNNSLTKLQAALVELKGR